MTVRVTFGPVTQISINDPKTRNALSVSTLRATAEAINSARHEPGVRLAVLTGANGTFSSGGNIKEAAPIDDVISAILAVYDAIADSPLPIVARVEGACLGLAVGIMAACDVVIVAEDTYFALPEVGMGQAPTMAALSILKRLRPADANELLLTGARFDGSHAVTVGLANRAIPAAEIDAEVGRWIDMLTVGGPQALAACKQLIRTIPDLGTTSARSFVSDLTRQLAGSEEARDGASAFAERRHPTWVKHETAPKESS